MRERGGGVSFWDSHTNKRGGTFTAGQPTAVMKKLKSEVGESASMSTLLTQPRWLCALSHALDVTRFGVHG